MTRASMIGIIHSVIGGWGVGCGRVVVREGKVGQWMTMMRGEEGEGAARRKGEKAGARDGEAGATRMRR